MADTLSQGTPMPVVLGVEVETPSPGTLVMPTEVA